MHWTTSLGLTLSVEGRLCECDANMSSSTHPKLHLDMQFHPRPHLDMQSLLTPQRCSPWSWQQLYWMNILCFSKSTNLFLILKVISLSVMRNIYYSILEDYKFKVNCHALVIYMKKKKERKKRKRKYHLKSRINYLIRIGRRKSLEFKPKT